MHQNKVRFLQICKASQIFDACSQSAAELEIVKIPAIEVVKRQ